MATFTSELRCSAKVPSALSALARYWWQLVVGACFWFSAHASATDWTIEDLGSAGGQYSIAYAINARGQVVGATGSLQAPVRHAFFYDGTHRMRRIGVLSGAMAAKLTASVCADRSSE